MNRVKATTVSLQKLVMEIISNKEKSRNAKISS